MQNEELYFDNVTEIVGEDILEELSSDDTLIISANSFSIYGFDALYKQLKKVKKMYFIFSDPIFLEDEQNNKQIKQFEINTLDQDSHIKSIAGTVFEINLRNQLTGQVIAKRCKEFIDAKGQISSILRGNSMQNIFIIQSKKRSIAYSGITSFTAEGLGFQPDNSQFTQIDKSTNQTKIEQSSKQLLSMIQNDSVEDIKDQMMSFLSSLYKENSPQLVYYFTLFNIFNEFLENLSEDDLPNESIGFKESKIWEMLYDFQKDAVLGSINKLEKFNGCILADSVGLGKTFTALGVIKYYQERNKSILVLCPKKLRDNWNTFNNPYSDNPVIEDRFNYQVLHHTDLSRERGDSNGIDLERINWGGYDLIVIDESHNFRNANQTVNKETNRLSRYQKLMQDVISKGVKTKVLMLSATPVNNNFNDLKNQLALAYEGNTHVVDKNLDVKKSIDVILKNVQEIFNSWTKLPLVDRTNEKLIKMLNHNFDFFKLLDNITISRSRKHIVKYYNSDDIGKFPERLKPIKIESKISLSNDFISMKEIHSTLLSLNLGIYSPTSYILPNRIEKYSKRYDTDLGDHKFYQAQREKSLKKLITINFLKRLESSVDSFRLTLEKFVKKIENQIAAIDDFKNNKKTHLDNSALTDLLDLSEEEATEFDQLEDIDDVNTTIGGKVQIDIADVDYLELKQDLEEDWLKASQLLETVYKVDINTDAKLKDLKDFIEEKVNNPINGTNKKILIFSVFADTTNYLYRNISSWAKDHLGLESALITGSNVNACTLDVSKQFNNLLTHFSPESKGMFNKDDSKHKEDFEEIDLLFATDCISEGQNLQDCDTVINFDIHWNPVRIIQRFGRIDRIGSINKRIQLVNFWPEISLDEYINLKHRVENRMVIADVTATGEDNVLTNKSSDLEFRKSQLQRLQDEVVDIEEMDTGVSLTDLGLNDFRMDLLSFMKNNTNLEKIPYGINAISLSNSDLEEGVIFVLKNFNSEVNIDSVNQLHPFYIVFISFDGEVLSNHLEVKNTLDILRSVAKDADKPIDSLCQLFNLETHDGTDMSTYSDLLHKAVASVVEIKYSSEVESIFSSGGTSFSNDQISGLNDFELVSFLIIKNGNN